MEDAEGRIKMPGGSKVGSKTLKLLGALRGFYKPSNEEVWVLAEVARLNKLYLAYLRAVKGVLEGELLREEAKYKWFMENAVGVISALNGLNYALYKFRRPLEHVSVDLDILIDRGDIPRAVQALVSRGFEVVVWEPYTVTLMRRGFVVDLYTEPSFAWVVYANGGRLLREYSEDVEVCGVRARALTREAEVAVAAAHAVYKEHLVLLMDCLVAWRWLGSGAWEVAEELKIEASLRELLEVCDLVRRGLAEAPYRLRPHTLARAYLRKALGDPTFRTTLPNALRYILSRKDIGTEILVRLIRRSY